LYGTTGNTSLFSELLPLSLLSSVLNVKAGMQWDAAVPGGGKAAASRLALLGEIQVPLISLEHPAFGHFKHCVGMH
jgi:hypothetical protein